MSLAFSTLSSASPGGERDCSIDLSNHLEDNEKITGTPTVVSSDVAKVSVSSVNASGNGKFIEFHLTVETVDLNETITLTVTFEGDSGSKGSYQIRQPVSPYLTS